MLSLAQIVMQARMVSSRALAILGRFCLQISQSLYESTSTTRVKCWYAANGDRTLRLEYDLDERSLVFDLGGYRGQWASDIYSMYGCTIHIFEPVDQFAGEIERRFRRNQYMILHRFGLSGGSRVASIAVDGDSSSLHRVGTESRLVRLVRTADFMDWHDIQKIDLMKINIEGGEYELLEHLIECNLVLGIRNIQVQFHDFVPNAERRMKSIQEALSRTHSLSYQYPFVWENWELRGDW